MHVRKTLSSLVLVSLFVFSAGCGGGASTVASGGATTPEAAPSGPEEKGKASYYSDRLAGRPTASGEPYEPSEMTAAHKTLPFGAVVRVRHVASGRTVEVRINDRGPHVRGRIIDLSRRAAEALGVVREGVAEVVLEVVSMPPAKKKKSTRK